MTITMQELIADREAIKNEIARLRNAGTLKAGTQEFAEFLDKLDAATRAIDDQERLEKLTANDTETTVVAKKKNGFKAVMNVLRGKKLSNDSETALIQGGEHGENYLIPEDVRLAINEAKKSRKSAKMLCTVMETDGIAGSFNFDASTDAGLVDFEDGDTLDGSVAPRFERKSFTIKYKGAYIPVSDLLRGNEQANLMAFLRGWFVKRAIKSENADIFATAKECYNDGTPKELADWVELKASINEDLDPAVSESDDFVIVTNQTGFGILDSAVDENGRPILQPNPTEPTKKMLSGHTIEVFSDAQLPNETGGKAPIIYGETKRALWFIENPAYQFASDDGKGIGFTKCQTILRVLEGYAVMGAHTEDYIYATLEPSSVGE